MIQKNPEKFPGLTQKTLERVLGLILKKTENVPGMTQKIFEMIVYLIQKTAKGYQA